MFLKSLSVTAVARRSAAALLAATFTLAYYPTLRKLIEYWAANDMYSHGFLVPLLAGYLIWLRRAGLRRTPIAASYLSGSAVSLCGLALLILGRVSSTNLIEELSLPVTICGVVLLVFGGRMTRALAFPIGYLLAMIPFWEYFTAPLQAPFQLYSAMLGVGPLRALGVPVVRDGVLIHLPNITLEVADVCSGINQLVAILCVGVPLAHLYVRGWPRRLFVLFAAAAIALVSNGVRVATISLIAYYGIRSADGDVHGPYSLLRMTLISAIGFLALIWLISRFADRGGDRATNEGTPLSAQPRRVSLAALSLATVLFVSVLAFERWHHVPGVPPGWQLTAFPTSIGRWQLSGDAPVTAAADAAGFDHRVSRRYRAADGAEVDLLVGYFERQRQGHELGGFALSPLLAAEAGLTTSDLGDGIRVREFRTNQDGRRYHVTYWYVLNGRITPQEYEAKWWTIWESLTRRRTNGSLILLRTALSTDEPADATRSRLRDLVQGLVFASRTTVAASAGF